MADIRTVPAVDAYVICGGMLEQNFTGTASFAPFAGLTDDVSTVADQRKTPMPESGTIEDIAAHVTYSSTGTATAKLFKNGVDTGFGFTWTDANNDAVFTGTAGVSFEAGDVLQWEVTHNAGVGRNMGFAVSSRVVPA